MTSSKVLFCLCISFIAGIFLGSIVKIPQIVSWGFLISGVLMIFISFWLVPTSKFNFGVWGFCILFLVLGIIRFQISEFTITDDSLSRFNDNPEKITLVGEVSHEPDVRDTFQKLKVHPVKFALGDVPPQAEQFNWVKIENTESVVLVTTGRYPEYKYLDTIEITGKLKTPGIFDNFNYKNYLLKDGIYSVMDYPNIQLLSNKHQYNVFSFLYEKVLFIKEKLLESLDMHFSPPQNTMLQGIVFGNDNNMPKDTKDKFNTTGLSHLTAVSGSNIVILISVLMAFLLWLGFWRHQAFYFAVIVIWVYIIMIGFPASGVRAAMMGCVALLAQNLGRQNTTSRIIVMVGALMLLQNPLLLFYDISFQLSFLASLGIIHFKPLVDILLGNMMKKGPFDSAHGKFKGFLDIISITLAAQIFTLPIIVYNFGNISLVSLVTNVLVLPIIPLLTILGFLVSCAGVFSTILGFILSLPCLFLLMYIIKVLDIFSKPWAVMSFENVSWIWLIIYYFFLSISIWFLDRKTKAKFLGY